MLAWKPKKKKIKGLSKKIGTAERFLTAFEATIVLAHAHVQNSYIFQNIE